MGYLPYPKPILDKFWDIWESFWDIGIDDSRRITGLLRADADAIIADELVFFLSFQVCALKPIDNALPDADPNDILDIDILEISVKPRRAAAPPQLPPQPTGDHRQVDAGRVAPLIGGAEGSSPVARPATVSPQTGAHWPGADLPTAAEAEAAPTHRTDEPHEPHWFGVMVREVVETVGLAVIIFLIIRVGIQNYRIEGASMEPNFHDGEYLIVNKLAYRLGEYERGDVIVFKYPNDPTKDYIKRVIGLPGDTVEIRAGDLYVNGVLIEEPYPHMPNTRDEPQTVVDAGHLYVMGDNRPASSDTRSWGQLGQEFVIGQAWLAIWPFDQAGLVEHHPIEVNAVMAQGP